MDTEKLTKWLHRPTVERTLEIVRALMLPLAVGGFVFWYLFALVGGCAPGPPQFSASDLTSADLTVANPPRTISVPVSDPEERERLFSAYHSMEKWRRERSAKPLPEDYCLELQLEGGRRLLVVAAEAGFPYGMVQEFEGQSLKTTAYVDLDQMRGYLLEHAE